MVHISVVQNTVLKLHGEGYTRVEQVAHHADMKQFGMPVLTKLQFEKILGPDPRPTIASSSSSLKATTALISDNVKEKATGNLEQSDNRSSCPGPSQAEKHPLDTPENAEKISMIRRMGLMIEISDGKSLFLIFPIFPSYELTVTNISPERPAMITVTVEIYVPNTHGFFKEIEPQDFTASAVPDLFYRLPTPAPTNEKFDFLIFPNRSVSLKTDYKELKKLYGRGERELFDVCQFEYSSDSPKKTFNPVGVEERRK
ncbi:MAG: hypothetical protein SGCHY_003314 [Lobulomycetales sp.]